MPRVRTVIFGGVVGGALSLLLAPRLGGVRRGPLARLGPLAVLDRRALAQFAGTPCSSRVGQGVSEDDPRQTMHGTAL